MLSHPVPLSNPFDPIRCPIKAKPIMVHLPNENSCFASSRALNQTFSVKNFMPAFIIEPLFPAEISHTKQAQRKHKFQQLKMEWVGTRIRRERKRERRLSIFNVVYSSRTERASEFSPLFLSYRIRLNLRLLPTLLKYYEISKLSYHVINDLETVFYFVLFFECEMRSIFRLGCVQFADYHLRRTEC